MSIEKNTSPMDIDLGESMDMPDIEIILDEDGGATVELGAGSEDLYDSTLTAISSELMMLFEADKSSRKDWEDQYGKGLELLGFTNEERTRPFRGACGVQHPLLSESIVQFQAQALKELLPSGGPVRTQVLGKETRGLQEDLL